MNNRQCDYQVWPIATTFSSTVTSALLSFLILPDFFAYNHRKMTLKLKLDATWIRQTLNEDCTTCTREKPDELTVP